MTDKNEFNIEKIANLSMLILSEEEEKQFSKDLEEIIEFAETITKANIIYSPDTKINDELKNVFREDIQSNSFGRDELLQNAENDGRYISVPKILEGN